ncbi:SDR family NAD(P)-dependent oxidoreductase [Paenibacillus pabuli]|uniref:SDR family NAD(P)-dependent oxidoreductase n=1 Tax=Paenibacillus pabuli TaxID=1472 RepID=UPI003CEDDC18
MKHNLFRLDKKDMMEKPENIKVIHDDGFPESRDIAIIGMAGRFPDADNLEEFWNNLQFGRDSSRPFPSRRREDTDSVLQEAGILSSNDMYAAGAYLERIDSFDYQFFSLSPKESSLMDPNQRMFMEMAYAAIEDAGYGGQKLSGSKTGVYVGYSSDFNSEYKQFVKSKAPSMSDMSTAGNIKSIIASRIAYFLDLRGPTMMVDTACSSSLVAVHLACQSLRTGECDMALAGGIKLNLLPLNNNQGESQIGIASSDGIARSFDDTSDGTGFGEGMGVVLLKPLHLALRDKDYIHAVIKGSAINQDGKSVGIVAPNPKAQEEVLVQAWKDAGIAADSISYIECHGTGTRLGDPIEVRGISQAFRKHTKANQFCAIGSVKTNIGHLDNAAGIAGLVKCVLSLKNRKIPPSLFFKKPNRGILFEDSPVYVNDNLQEWSQDEGPRRCGVSAFGLSGTNCHVVLEEAPAAQKVVKASESKINLLVLSAQDMSSLQNMVEQYLIWIDRNPNVCLSDLCYTLNTGRGHHSNRLAVVFSSFSELREKLTAFLDLSAIEVLTQKGIHYGVHKLIPDSLRSHTKKANEITQHMANQLTDEARLMVSVLSEDPLTEELGARLCELYVRGATVDWESVYRNVECRKLSLPYYPFNERRCWLIDKEKDRGVESTHPLINEIEYISNEILVCYSTLSADHHWVLSDHKVNKDCVLPGTAYLEIAGEASRKFGVRGNLEFRDVMFITPFALKQGESATLVTKLRKRKEGFGFEISSLNGETIFAQGIIVSSSINPQAMKKDEMINLMNTSMEDVAQEEGSTGPIERGPRWSCLRKFGIFEEKVMAYLQLPDLFETDLSQYHYHPALLDCAANVMIDHFDGLYLPFSYKKITFLTDELPGEIYSHTTFIESTNRKDSKSFDITLLDSDGNIIAIIENYTIRKIFAEENNTRAVGEQITYFVPQWEEETVPEYSKQSGKKGSILFLSFGKKTWEQDLTSSLQSDGYKIYESQQDENYGELLEIFQDEHLEKIIYVSPIDGYGGIHHMDDLNECLENGIYKLFRFIKTTLLKRPKGPTELVMIYENANRVTGAERYIIPENSMFSAMGKVVSQENPNFSYRAIDIDDSVNGKVLKDELYCANTNYQIAFRDNKRYVEQRKQLTTGKGLGHELVIKDDGVYIITGGLGSLGLEVARQLATRNPKVSLALLNRTGVYESLGGEETSDTVQKQKDRMQKVSMLKEMGIDVSIYQADVSNLTEMMRISNELKGKYGSIRGIIHCAGIAGKGLLINKEFERFREVLQPKVHGTWLLDKTMTDKNTDFIVYFSSINSLIGGFGQSDYAAANAYLNAYAAKLSLTGVKATSINWPAWSEIGMAVDFRVDLNNSDFPPALTTEEALQCFDEIIGAGLIDVLPYKMKRTELNQSVVKMQNKKAESPVIENIIGDSNNKSTLIQVETKVIQAFAEVLGYDNIEINDNFFDLGGDSVIATHLFKKLDSNYEGYIEIADIFTRSTPLEIAGAIFQKLSDSSPVEVLEKDELDMLLHKLYAGEIDINDVEAMLN